MKLSVVIVNWNVRDLLRDCLRSLFEQTALEPDEWEVLVVDNHSTDGSVVMLHQEFPHVHVIANTENVGFGRANNQAFTRCRGEFILLLNPDTEVLDQAITRMLSIASQMPRVGALGCQLLNTDGSFQRWTGGSLPSLRNVSCHFLLLYRLLPWNWLPGPLYLEHQPKTDLDVGWVSGACLLLRREALNGCLFDERFFLYGEDLDLCRRIQAGGRWRVVYTPRVAITHHAGKSLDRTPPEFQASKTLGLRQAFVSERGPAALLAYDVFAVTGFALRYAFLSVASILRSDAAISNQRRLGAHYVRVSFRALIRRQ